MTWFLGYVRNDNVNPSVEINTKLYVCISVDGMNWTGNDIIFNEYGYGLGSEVVELTSIGFIPEIGKIYNREATVELVENSQITNDPELEYYECNSMDSGTAWSGYKMTWTESGWVRSNELIKDLPIQGFDPEVGDIYNIDTTVRVELYNYNN